MLRVTRDLILPTAITGSYPRPLWYDANLSGRSFKAALGDSMFREQYFDAVAAVINAQEAAGLDIVTDGDSRFDLAVGGKSRISHCNTVVEPPEYVAGLIRKALEYIPPERLVVTTDCGFGREGLSRRIAYYKCVALVEGTNIVRRELGLPEARVRASDPTLYFHRS